MQALRLLLEALSLFLIRWYIIQDLQKKYIAWLERKSVSDDADRRCNTCSGTVDEPGDEICIECSDMGHVCTLCAVGVNYGKYCQHCEEVMGTL